MEFEYIIYEKQDHVAIVKLNRPNVLNAMNKQLWLDFQVSLEDVNQFLPIFVYKNGWKSLTYGVRSK